MSSKQPDTVSENEKLKRQLLWKKVNDPDFTKPLNEQRKIYQRTSLGKAGVPMIPDDLIGGTSNKVAEGRMYRNLSINPLVPIGMVLTVGCLIGMFKSSLNRNMLRTQYYMRGRIAAQFFTVCALVGGASMFGLDPRKSAKEPDVITKAILQQNSN